MEEEKCFQFDASSSASINAMGVVIVVTSIVRVMLCYNIQYENK